MTISDTAILFGTPVDADPNANKSYLVISSSISMVVLSILAVFLRFISRWMISVPFLLDDWLMLAALPFTVILPAIDIYGATTGYFGRHLLSAPDPLEYLPVFLKGSYTYDICYNFAIGLTKLSMLAIYWRIFHANSFKLPLLLTAGATIAWFLACTLVAIFSCTPIQGFWDRTINSTCVDNFSFYIGQAAANIALDIVLLAIPIFRVFRLSISRSQKLAISGIFLIGAFTTIASALRLNELIRSLFVPFQDPTFELVGSAVWSVIETGLSVVCGCLPTMRPLLRLVLNGGIMPTSGVGGGNSRSSQYYSRSESRAKSGGPNNWPLPKRASDMGSPVRGDFHLSQPRDTATTSPTNRSHGGQQWGSLSDRPLVHNPTSFTTKKYYASVTPGDEGEKEGDIEMAVRNVGYGRSETGDARGERAYDAVSLDGRSVGTADTDTSKFPRETRPVDGF